MKVILNDYTPLQVISSEGGIVYEWNPFEDRITNLKKKSMHYEKHEEVVTMQKGEQIIPANSLDKDKQID